MKMTLVINNQPTASFFESGRFDNIAESFDLVRFDGTPSY